MRAIRFDADLNTMNQTKHSNSCLSRKPLACTGATLSLKESIISFARSLRIAPFRKLAGLRIVHTKFKPELSCNENQVGFKIESSLIPINAFIRI